MNSKKFVLIEARAQARRIMDCLRGEFNLKNPDFDRLYELANNLQRHIEMFRIIDAGGALVLDVGIAKQQILTTSGASIAPQGSA